MDEHATKIPRTTQRNKFLTQQKTSHIPPNNNSFLVPPNVLLKKIRAANEDIPNLTSNVADISDKRFTSFMENQIYSVGQHQLNQLSAGYTECWEVN